MVLKLILLQILYQLFLIGASVVKLVIGDGAHNTELSPVCSNRFKKFIKIIHLIWIPYVDIAMLREMIDDPTINHNQNENEPE